MSNRVARITAARPHQPAQVSAPSKTSWDLEDEDPVIKFYIARFVSNLIATTTPNSKLAYRLCNLMEADLLEIPGLMDVFPTSRVAHKLEVRSHNKEKKDLETRLRAAKTELRELQRDSKQHLPDEPLESLMEQLAGDIRELKRELDDHGTKADYKESYPFNSTAHHHKSGVVAADWKILQDFFTAKTRRAPKNSDSNFIKNTEMLCTHLGFSKSEQDALILILVSYDDSDFTNLLDALFAGKQKNAHAVIAKMLGVERDVISKMFRPTSPLVEKGILIPANEIDFNSDPDEDADIMPIIADNLIQVLKEPDLTLGNMLERFIGAPAQTDLDWDKDFGYLGESGARIILRG